MTTAESKARETKECGLCKCTIERGKRDSCAWAKLKYCNQRCAALYRGVLMGAWKSETKECKVCQAVFRPRPGIPKSGWRRVKCCSDKCSRKAQTGRIPQHDRRIPKYRFQKIPIDPADCKTASQRLRFLRLSRSPEGVKKPISMEEMVKQAKIGQSTLARIESDASLVSPKAVKRLCKALKIDPEWLKWSEKKWTRVISGTKLTATELVKIKTENQ